MTDAPPSYDEIFPPLDGPVIANNLSNTINLIGNWSTAPTHNIGHHINNNNNNNSNIDTTSSLETRQTTLNQLHNNTNTAASAQQQHKEANNNQIFYPSNISDRGDSKNYLGYISFSDEHMRLLYQQHQERQKQQQEQHQHLKQQKEHQQQMSMNLGPISAPIKQQQYQTQKQQTNMQGNPSTQKRQGMPHPITSSERSITFKVAPEERRYRDFEAEQSKILKEIMLKTSTKIEVSASKDGGLNFCIYGKGQALQQAKNLILNDFQTSVTLTVSVPKSVHGRLLGPRGTRLQGIQNETQTKITIPRVNDDSDIISVVGLKHKAEEAVQHIQKLVRESKTTEKISVEKIYLLFVTGPFQENIKRWESMGVVIKISYLSGVYGPGSEKDLTNIHSGEATFTLVGEAEVVATVKNEIQRIYEDRKKKCTTVNIEVKKAQHRYIVGPKAQNLHNLFAKTGVSIEMPPHESESETVTLRGEQSKLGPALSVLYSQAHSETDDFFEVDNWLHKYLIGNKRSNVVDFKSRNVDVKSMEDKIKLHGPPAEVESVKDLLEAELNDITKTKRIIRKDVKVEPRLHGFIIGRAGATVKQIRNESGALILVPENDESSSDFITLEGSAEAVAIAEEKINNIAKKFESSRKLVINQQLHGLIIGKKGEKIKEIRDKFNQITITFPEPGSKCNEVTILGPAEDVDKCYEYLLEFHKQLQENNHQIQVPIKNDVIKYVNDAQQAIRRIKIDGRVKVDIISGANSNSTIESNDSNNSDNANNDKKGGKKGSQNQSKQGNSNKENYAIITGRKEDAELAKGKLTKLFDELSTTTEIELTIPHKLHNHIGPKSKPYRQLVDDFHNKISIIFPAANSSNSAASIHQRQNGGEGGDDIKKPAPNGKMNGVSEQINNKSELVKLRGPKNFLKKAEKRLEALIAECQDRLDKNFQTAVPIESNIYKKFAYSDRQRVLKLKEIHNLTQVNIRRVASQMVVTLSGYEKAVNAASQQLNKLIKEVEERVEERIDIPSRVHPMLIGSQGRAVKKIMEEFKVEIKFARQDDEDPDHVTLYGRPENIKAAKQQIQKSAEFHLLNVDRLVNHQQQQSSETETTTD